MRLLGLLLVLGISGDVRVVGGPSLGALLLAVAVLFALMRQEHEA